MCYLPKISGIVFTLLLPQDRMIVFQTEQSKWKSKNLSLSNSVINFVTQVEASYKRICGHTYSAGCQSWLFEKISAAGPESNHMWTALVWLPDDRIILSFRNHNFATLWPTETQSTSLKRYKPLLIHNFYSNDKLKYVSQDYLRISLYIGWSHGNQTRTTLR